MALYAGDVLPKQAWDGLNDKAAQLVDVRTIAELSFVGIPDLSEKQKKPIFIEWQVFPSMQQNMAFSDHLTKELDARGLDQATPLYFLCRSGGRSQAAAVQMSSLGFRTCYNIAFGFEGDLDADRHRGSASGWKADGLPWVQS